MYKITKSETKKIGTIKLPKGVWLNHISSKIEVSINAEVAPYVDRQHILHNIGVLLSNYKREIFHTINIIEIYNCNNLKIDYDCTKSDCTNEWTFYEKVEDTVKIKPNTPEEIWAETAYTFAKGENTFKVTM